MICAILELVDCDGELTVSMKHDLTDTEQQILADSWGAIGGSDIPFEMLEGDGPDLDEYECEAPQWHLSRGRTCAAAVPRPALPAHSGSGANL